MSCPKINLGVDVLHTLFQYDLGMKTDHLLGKDISMQSVTLSARQRVAPVVTLLILAPVIVEVLFGATHITTLYLLIIQIGCYGCAALIIRDLVRRQQKGWFAILLLGIAYALFEECVMLQTSLYPIFAFDLQNIYGRAFGVNWIYLLNMLGYQSVWAIVVPIQLTELIFPSRRDEPWLSKRALVIAAIAFILASTVAWYTWTQRAVHIFYPGLAYQPPLLTIVIVLAVIVVLAIAALAPWSPPRLVRKSDRPVPRPWLVGLIAFVLGLPWFGLILLQYGVAPSLPVVIPIGGIVAWAVVAFFLVRYWSASPAWQDAHRLALIFGALLASMLAGFWVSGVALPADLIGKLVLNVIAVLLLGYLGRKLRQRKVA